MIAAAALLPLGWFLLIAPDVSGPPALPVDVIGPDDRVPADSGDTALMSALGILYPEGEVGSTAFLIGACDVLATARHTVAHPDGTPYADRMEFIPAAGGASIQVIAGSVATGASHDDADDWAVMRLAAPVPGCVPFVPWPIADAALPGIADRLVLAGYHADLDRQPYVQAGCTIPPPCLEDTYTAGVIIHDCDSDVGASGAPLHVAIGTRRFVVAVHARHSLPGGSNVCDRSNLAVRLNATFLAALEELGVPVGATFLGR